jgi:hypothetical protein
MKLAACTPEVRIENYWNAEFPLLSAATLESECSGTGSATA